MTQQTIDTLRTALAAANDTIASITASVEPLAGEVQGLAKRYEATIAKLAREHEDKVAVLQNRIAELTGQMEKAAPVAETEANDPALDSVLAKLGELRAGVTELERLGKARGL